MEFNGGMTFSGAFTITAPPPPPSAKAIFGYGVGPGFPGNLSTTNLVTNTGVVGNDVTGVGLSRVSLAAASYGS